MVSWGVIGLWIEPKLVRVKSGVRGAATAMVLAIVTIAAQRRLEAALSAAVHQVVFRFFIFTRRVN